MIEKRAQNEKKKPDSAVNGKRRIQTLKGLLSAYGTYAYMIYFDYYSLQMIMITDY